MNAELLEQLGHATRSTVLQNVRQRIEPQTVLAHSPLAATVFPAVAQWLSAHDLMRLSRVCKAFNTLATTLDANSAGESAPLIAAFRGDEKALFNDADTALYRAKGCGKDCVVAADDLDDGASALDGASES